MCKGRSDIGTGSREVVEPPSLEILGNGLDKALSNPWLYLRADLFQVGISSLYILVYDLLTQAVIPLDLCVAR